MRGISPAARGGAAVGAAVAAAVADRDGAALRAGGRVALVLVRRLRLLLHLVRLLLRGRRGAHEGLHGLADEGAVGVLGRLVHRAEVELALGDVRGRAATVDFPRSGLTRVHGFLLVFHLLI